MSIETQSPTAAFWSVSWKGVDYDSRHGGPFDRGSADSYYHRRRDPHYFLEGTHTSPRIDREDMTDLEIDAYYAGYEYNEESGDKKDWG